MSPTTQPSVFLEAIDWPDKHTGPPLTFENRALRCERIRTDKQKEGETAMARFVVSELERVDGVMSISPSVCLTLEISKISN